MGRTAGARPPADHPKVDATRERRGQWGSISAPAASPAAKRLRLNLASCEPNRAYPCRSLRTNADVDAKAASTSAPVCGCGCAQRPQLRTASAASDLPWAGLTLTPSCRRSHELRRGLCRLV